MSTDPDPFSPDRLMVGRHNEDPLEPLEVELLQRADDEDHPSEIPPPRAGDEETHQTPPGEHTHRLLRLLRSRSSRDRGVPSMLATFQDPDFRHAAARMIGRDDLASTWRGYLHGDNNPGAYPIPRRTVRSQQHSPTLNVPEQPAVGIERDSRENRRQATEAANRRRLRFGDHSRSVRLVDGLGDRDRSLSPEGDGVWDTLQSTLTPDPQPPSVGSSFASTSASTATSQHPTVPSSRTSITGPSEDVEPPCDPVNEPEGFVEGSEDAEAPHLDQPRRSSPHGRLSYAEAAVSGTGSSTGEPEWLPGMHHIIRRLAARQDIPDEWWQQAGLSRSMSWESIN
ncbi:hypothetical protein F5Y06DRAFT_273150 [Hypoxylon sp. FL0890]|nr:hypothetical protein F5Y06DRAFT_273150 [Hypoxylon sp. FL0890]